MKTTTRHLIRLFVTGVLAALPLAATLLVLWWVVSLLLQWVGPGSGFGQVMRAVGFGVTGSGLVGYVIGILVALGALVLLGALVERGLERGVQRMLDAVLGRIPVVRTVWDLAQRLVGLLQQRDELGARSMSPVWCHFGGLGDPDGPGGAAVLGLLSSPQPVMVGGRPCLAVLVPTAPIPVGGGLLFVPAEWVTPARLGMESLTSIYVSMGVTSAQHLPSAGPVLGSAAAQAAAAVLAAQVAAEAEAAKASGAAGATAPPGPPAPPAPQVPPSNAA